MPNHLIPLTIVKELGNPIITTSIKEEKDELTPYITDPDLIYEKYEKLVDIIIDGGNTGNIPSTILNCTDDSCEVVREGAGSINWL